MACIINNDASSAIYGPVEKHEHHEALSLWYTVFNILPPGFFERYLASEASPRYQPDDRLCARYDGKLVSTIHIRRLTFRLRNDNREYLCAGISAVATFEKYRRRGYSRHLLRIALDKMEKGGEFDMALLDTNVPNHYSILGWEQITVPSPVCIEWKNFSPDNYNVEWRPASDVLLSDGQLLLEIYSNKPRAYQLDRSPLIMFQHWTGYYWRIDEAIICVLGGEEKGYVVITKPNDLNDVCVSEWRAPDIYVEKKLFKLAAVEIERRHPKTKVIRFQGVPQYMSLNELKVLADAVNIETRSTTMLRNLRLSTETFEDMKAAFYSGEAIWWQSDDF